MKNRVRVMASLALCVALPLWAKPVEKRVTKESVMQYLIARNNFIYCQLPDIWNAKNDTEKQAILDRWAESENEKDRFRFNQYIHATNRLAEMYFDRETVTEMWTGAGSGISGYLDSMTDAEQRVRTMNSVAQCRKKWAKPL